MKFKLKEIILIMLGFFVTVSSFADAVTIRFLKPQPAQLAPYLSRMGKDPGYNSIVLCNNSGYAIWLPSSTIDEPQVGSYPYNFSSPLRWTTFNANPNFNSDRTCLNGIVGNVSANAIVSANYTPFYSNGVFAYQTTSPSQAPFYFTVSGPDGASSFSYQGQTYSFTSCSPNPANDTEVICCFSTNGVCEPTY